MKYKSYIVANEQQEREVLEKLEREECIWAAGGENPTKWVPSQHHVSDKEGRITFPLKIINDGGYIWQGRVSNEATDEEIVYDGRKEKRMSEKYVVSQEFMNELEEWKYKYFNDANYFVSHLDIRNLPHIVSVWKCDGVYDNEANNRLIAIIRWVNGEDVFEVEKPKKLVVRSKDTDSTGKYHYSILSHFSDLPSMDYYFVYDADGATKFDTKEEAESWANSHQEVVEVEE